MAEGVSDRYKNKKFRVRNVKIQPLDNTKEFNEKHFLA